MINSVADEAGFPDTTASWIDGYPLLKPIFPPGSTEREKVACLLRLFEMALRPEEEV